MKKSSAPQGNAPDEKPHAMKSMKSYRWLRQLRRGDANQEKAIEMTVEPTVPTLSLQRPRTAPSSGTAQRPVPFSAAQEAPLPHLRNQPPPRPPRPDSAVMRDVNAWLDASVVKPSAPIMSGIQYWREGSPAAGSPPTADVRYAVPIVHTSAVAHNSNVKSFCRRAKRMQVRMPTLLRTKSNRGTVSQRQPKTYSTSMPVISLPAPAAALHTSNALPRSRSLAQPSRRPASRMGFESGSVGFDMGGHQHLNPPPPFGGNAVSSSSIREQESRMERHIHAFFNDNLMAMDSVRVRPATAGQTMPREDSMGNISDAPTYSSGAPPPSYQSRAASVLSTSSFGCIDGMSAARRQISQQQRAAQRPHGVKGRLKRMAQKAHLTK